MRGFSEFVIFVLALGFPALWIYAFVKTRKRSPSRAIELDNEALNTAETNLRSQGEKPWVIVRRCHGPAYTHHSMSEIVGYLAAEGVEATYDVYGISSADMGVTNFTLKVLSKDEERAKELLSRMDST